MSSKEQNGRKVFQVITEWLWYVIRHEGNIHFKHSYHGQQSSSQTFGPTMLMVSFGLYLLYHHLVSHVSASGLPVTTELQLWALGSQTSDVTDSKRPHDSITWWQSQNLNKALWRRSLWQMGTTQREPFEDRPWSYSFFPGTQRHTDLFC